MQKHYTIKVLIIGLFIFGLLPSSAEALESDISITSPSNGGEYLSGNSITFSWSSPRSGTSWRMYYQIDGGTWTTGALPSGSFTQSPSAGSHTFSVKIQQKVRTCIEFFGYLKCYDSWPTRDTDTVSYDVLSGDISITNPSSNYQYLDFSSDKFAFTANVDALSNYFKVYTRQSSTTSYSYIKTVSTDNVGGNYNFDLAYWDLRGDEYSPEFLQYLKVVNYDDDDSAIDTYYRYFNVKWNSADIIKIDIKEGYADGTELGDEEYFFKLKEDGGSWSTSGVWKKIDDPTWFSVNWYQEYSNYVINDKIFIEMWEEDPWPNPDDDVHKGSIKVTNANFRKGDWTSVTYTLDDDQTWTDIYFDKDSQDGDHRMKIVITLTGLKCN